MKPDRRSQRKSCQFGGGARFPVYIRGVKNPMIVPKKYALVLIFFGRNDEVEHVGPAFCQVAIGRLGGSAWVGVIDADQMRCLIVVWVFLICGELLEDGARIDFVGILRVGGDVSCRCICGDKGFFRPPPSQQQSARLIRQIVVGSLDYFLKDAFADMNG